MPRYVGIDLPRRRSVVVIMDPDGAKVSSRRIENSRFELASAVAEAGSDPEVVLEATWGWYWAADVLEEPGARVHLAHPLGLKGNGSNHEVSRKEGHDLLESVGLQVVVIALPTRPDEASFP